MNTKPRGSASVNCSPSFRSPSWSHFRQKGKRTFQARFFCHRGRKWRACLLAGNCNATRQISLAARKIVEKMADLFDNT
jgi:hypothetical protein